LHNPLALLYLDYAQVMQTTAQDVTKLLDQFWKHYLNDDQKLNALSVLGLSEPVDFDQIKKQYRRLAMKHHPDRGGDADQLIAVYQAMQCLEMYY
jgi:DnaJ-domain-containing protein 1